MVHSDRDNQLTTRNSIIPIKDILQSKLHIDDFLESNDPVHFKRPHLQNTTSQVSKSISRYAPSRRILSPKTTNSQRGNLNSINEPKRNNLSTASASTLVNTCRLPARNRRFKSIVASPADRPALLTIEDTTPYLEMMQDNNQTIQAFNPSKFFSNFLRKSGNNSRILATDLKEA